MSDPTRNDCQKIIDAVDMAFDEQLKFTQQLVRLPSLRSAENPAQDFLLAAMIERGLETDRWRLEVDAIKHHPGFGPVDVSYADAYNVVGSYLPEKPVGRSLILNGHIDVVPTGPLEMWARSPWDPAIVDGWMYGRGSADMKAGLAANFFAYDAVRAAGYTPTAPIFLQSVVEEECTGNGALSALLRGYTADAVIIPEPEENMLVRANVGVLWFKVRVDGRPAHTREMSSGFNAIDAAFRLIGALRELESAWNGERHRHPYFEHLEHPINFNVGKIVGGDWPSTVPAWCEFEVRIAIYPGVGADEARAHIEQCIRDAAAGDPSFGGVQPTVRFHGFYSEGYVLEPGSDAENVLRDCHGRVFDEELAAFTTPGYLDGRVFALYGGIPTLVYGPKSLNIHAFDERVHLDSLRKVTKTIALFIAHWCGIA